MYLADTREAAYTKIPLCVLCQRGISLWYFTSLENRRAISWNLNENDDINGGCSDNNKSERKNDDDNNSHMGDNDGDGDNDDVISNSNDGDNISFSNNDLPVIEIKMMISTIITIQMMTMIMIID